MADIDDLDAAIQQLATDGIASVTVGNQTTTVKSIDELLKWRKQLKSDSAASQPAMGLRFTQLVPGGCG